MLFFGISPFLSPTCSTVQNVRKGKHLQLKTSHLTCYKAEYKMGGERWYLNDLLHHSFHQFLHSDNHWRSAFLETKETPLEVMSNLHVKMIQTEVGTTKRNRSVKTAVQIKEETQNKYTRNCLIKPWKGAQGWKCHSNFAGSTELGWKPDIYPKKIMKSMED